MPRPKEPFAPLDPSTWAEDLAAHQRLEAHAYRVATRALPRLERWYRYVDAVDLRAGPSTWKATWACAEGELSTATLPVGWLFLDSRALDEAIDRERAHQQAVEASAAAVKAHEAAKKAEERERVELARLRRKYPGDK